jgi:hypothetical protein
MVTDAPRCAVKPDPNRQDNPDRDGANAAIMVLPHEICVSVVVTEAGGIGA